MSLVKAFVVSVATLFLLTVFLAGWSAYYYVTPETFSEPTTVIIERDSKFRGVIAALEEKRVISRPWLFAGIAVASGSLRHLKAGEYLFLPNATPAAILDMLVRGEVVVHKITIPEGLTIAQVTLILDKEAMLTGVVDMSVPEGSLLPDTYQFLYHDKRQDIIKHMQFQQKVLLSELWNKRSAELPFKTPQDAVTLASIVEKETALPEERGRIAAVFVNRLKRGMPLQADPTIIYALEKESGPLGRPLTTVDLAIDSPYNTYRVVGLPPTPICNPGRASIEAVFNPPDTGDYYFVADGKGGHHFSSTLEQHNGYVKEYRRQLKQQKQTKP